MAIFIIVLSDNSNGFNSHLVQFHSLLGGAAISKTVPENFPVFEPFEKCLLAAANSCQKLLKFLGVFISHNHNLAWFPFIPTISNNAITLFNLKIQGLSIPIFLAGDDELDYGGTSTSTTTMTMIEEERDEDDIDVNATILHVFGEVPVLVASAS